MSGSVNAITAALPPQSNQSNPLQQLETVQSIINSRTLNTLWQQELQNKQQELQNLQLTNKTGQASLSMADIQRHGQIMYGLNNMTDNQLKGGAPLYASLENERENGIISNPANYQAMKAQIDQITAAGGDKDGSLYRPLLSRGLAISGAMTGPQQVEFLQGRQQPTTTPGGMTQEVSIPGQGAPPGTPTTNVGTPYGGGLSPAEGVQPITVYLPDGTSTQISGQQARQYQINGLPPGLSWKPMPASAPAAGPAPTTAPSAAPAPAAAPRGPAGTGTIPGMGGQIPNEPQKTAAIQSQQQATTSMTNISSRAWADQQGSLQSVINLANTVSSGPGTEWTNSMKQLVSNITPGLATALGIDPSKASDTQDYAKLLARISSSAGYGSDAQMFEAIASNPNTKMNPDALRRAAGYMKSLNDQEEVLTRAASAQATNQPLDITTWYGNKRAEIQSGLDQSAFRVPYMTDSEYAAYKKSLNTPDKINAAKHTFDLMHQYLHAPMSLNSTSQPQGQ